MASAARVGDEDAFRSATCAEEDILEFVGEMLGLGLPGVTQAIADAIVAELLLPQLFVLAAWHQPKPVQIRPIFDCFPDETKPPAIIPRPSEFSMYQDMLRAMSPSPAASPAAAQDAEEEPPDELEAALAVRKDPSLADGG
ncbi:MKK3 [Symbiodinium sp. CCMP2456]|nr:MKK3 [Symbiodinium sp. CCMP2456]